MKQAVDNSDNFWERSFVKTDDIISREIAGETILVPVKGKMADMQRIYTLNPVARHIWMNIDGAKTIGAIRDEILENFDVEKVRLEKDVREFIEELFGENLIR